MQGVAMSHPIIEDLLWRHATKKYDASRRVSEEDLNVIFEAMRLTASSINSQPWKFLVIESNAAKERMNRTFANRFQYNQPHVFASSHIILFAYNPYYTRDNFAEIVDDAIKDKRTKPEDREQAFGSFMFAELNTDETGNTATWTIDSTPMEGIDIDLVNEEFKDELDGYQCDVALAIGYHHQEQDYNAKLPKSRRSLDSVMVRI
jgi:nitroreductase/dihydropteridine reductase